MPLSSSLPSRSPLQRVADEIVGGLAQDRLGDAAAIHQFLADLQQHRHGQRRHVGERLVADAALDAGQEVAEPADVEEAGRGIRPGRLQQDVAGIVLRSTS